MKPEANSIEQPDSSDTRIDLDPTHEHTKQTALEKIMAYIRGDIVAKVVHIPGESSDETTEDKND